VIFDLDGLMVDSEPLATWSWREALARYGHVLDEETVMEMMGLRLSDSVQVVCRKFELPIGPERMIAERDALFLEAVPTHLEANAGLHALLDALDARGVPLAVATSSHRRYLALALETLGLTGRFRALASGAEVAHGKPAPDVYLLAAERLGVPPTRCLALEDTPLGLRSALAAGMVGVAVPNPQTAALDFPGAHRVYASLEDVRRELDELLDPGSPALETVRYEAAGGVVVHAGRVLVLRRPGRDEVRLPKGHVEPEEDVPEAALRETREESGYQVLEILTDLGAQRVEFEHQGRRIVRHERYFLMGLDGRPEQEPAEGEEQFEPWWVGWDEALSVLTFEAEREWVRRARVSYERRER
jgi:HAD superfamily hydrolase (TIGR01509 family)